MYIGGYYVVPKSLSDIVFSPTEIVDYNGAFELFRTIFEVSKTKMVLFNVEVVSDMSSGYGTVPAAVSSYNNAGYQIVITLYLITKQLSLTTREDDPNKISISLAE